MYDDGRGISTEKCYAIDVDSELESLDCDRDNWSGDNTDFKYFHSKDKAIEYIKRRDWKEGDKYWVSDHLDEYPMIMMSDIDYGVFKDKDGTSDYQFKYFEKFTGELPTFK